MFIQFLPIAFLINTMRRKCSGYTYGAKSLINLHTESSRERLWVSSAR